LSHVALDRRRQAAVGRHGRDVPLDRDAVAVAAQERGESVGM
jgi:hypothetical protein